MLFPELIQREYLSLGVAGVAGVAATAGVAVALVGVIVFRASRRREPFAARLRRRRHIRYLARTQKDLAEFQLFLEQADQTRHPIYKTVIDMIAHVGVFSNSAVLSAARAEVQTAGLPEIARQHRENNLSSGPASPVRLSNIAASEPVAGSAPERKVFSLENGTTAEGPSSAAHHIWASRKDVQLSK